MSRLGSASLVVLAFVLIVAGSAIAANPTSQYASQFGVSQGAAERNLARQSMGTGLVEKLEAAQGSRFAGVWFDDKSGEFVVPQLPEAPEASVDSVLEDAGIGEAAVRTPTVQSSWDELAAEQSRLDGQLAGMIQTNVVQTSIEPRTNSVLILEASSIGNAAKAAVAQLAEAADVGVETRVSQLPVFGATTSACNVGTKSCDPPIRGGDYIEGSSGTVACTAGFNAIGLQNGNHFVLTAGHCYRDSPFWRAYESQNYPQYLGEAQEGAFPGSDYAKISVAANSYWTKGWTSQVVAWGSGFENISISSESASYLGEYVCHSGATSGTSCGSVTSLDKTINYPQGTVYGLTEASGPSFCTKPGDSGGPVWSGQTAVGLISGAEEAECGGHKGYYNEVTEAAEAMGVSVGSRVNVPPAILESGVNEVGPFQATGAATIDPNGLNTSIHVEYGLTSSYGQSSESREVGSGWQPRPGGVEFTGLQSGTTYHFRIVASNGAGVSFGPDHTFTTALADGHPVSMRDPVTNKFWIYYRGSEGYMWELYRDPATGSWFNNKVPAFEAAAPGSSPVIGRNSTSNAQWIYYRGADGYIYELFRNPTTGEWANNKVPALEPEAAGTSPTMLGDPSVGQAWIYYQGADGYIYELFRNPTTGEWANNKVPALERAAVGTTPVIGRNASSNAMWIYYQGADGYIYELFRNPTTGEWANNKVPAIRTAAPGTSPTMLGDPSVGQAWIYYRGSDGYIWELYRNPTSGEWADNKVPATEPAGAGTTPVIGRNATSNAQWIYYQGADGYIWELYRNPSSGLWSNTKIPNAQAAAPGTSPTMLGDPSVGEAWIEYWGSDGYMWELWRNPSTGVWANGQFPTAHR